MFKRPSHILLSAAIFRAIQDGAHSLSCRILLSRWIGLSLWLGPSLHSGCSRRSVNIGEFSRLYIFMEIWETTEIRVYLWPRLLGLLSPTISPSLLAYLQSRAYTLGIIQKKLNIRLVSNLYVRSTIYICEGLF